MAVDSNIAVVTGTNTEIGKTVVACGLVRRLADEGIEVRAVKPVESGIDELEPDERDGVQLARAARQSRPSRALDELGRPLAPPEAADLAGVELSMQAWCREIEALAAESDLVVVEGAGGLLSPLTWTETARELAERLSAGVLVVAPDTLGVLTHSLTALESLDRASSPLLGVVFSAPDAEDESTRRNPETLARYADLERVSRLPRVTGWREAAEHLDRPAEWVRRATL